MNRGSASSGAIYGDALLSFPRIGRSVRTLPTFPASRRSLRRGCRLSEQTLFCSFGVSSESETQSISARSTALSPVMFLRCDTTSSCQSLLLKA